MMKWLSIFCSKCQMLFDMGIDELLSKPVYPKLTLFIFFCSSLSFAVILTVVPNLISLWVQSQQSWRTLMTTFSFSGHSHSKPQSSVSTRLQTNFKFDLCSREFSALETTAFVTRGDLSTETISTNSARTTDHIHRHSKSSELHTEALSAVYLAKEMVANGKMERAAKLFEHAIALDPHHPDILTEYGEFYEKQHKDIVNAEHMYCRALITNPSHQKALINRKRTQPLVEEIDTTYYNLIDQKRKLLLGIPENHPGIKRMMVESYFKHIYHTTALEGNTFTLSQTRMLVENRLAIGGKSVVEHNEIIGMDSAFTYVNNTLLDRLGSLTVQDIKNIHKRVLGFVDPIGAGEFRTTEVVVADFTPPDPQEVPHYMEEFIEWLNSEEALSLHPIELAALAHYKFVWIHPFYDGNGRTSRLLMNMVLMQAGYPPIIIQKEEKHVYYEHLQTANNGDVRPFIRFIGLCTERAIDEYLLAGLENARSLVAQFRTRRKAPWSPPVDDGRTIIVDDDDNE